MSDGIGRVNDGVGRRPPRDALTTHKGMIEQFDDTTDGEQSLRSELSRVLEGIGADADGPEPFVLADPEEDVLHVISFEAEDGPRHVGTASTEPTDGDQGEV